MLRSSIMPKNIGILNRFLQRISGILQQLAQSLARNLLFAHQRTLQWSDVWSVSLSIVGFGHLYRFRKIVPDGSANLEAEA